MRVGAIFPGGPAAFAGLRVGDVLLTIGGAPANSRPAAELAIENLAPGKPAILTARRGKQSLQLRVIPETYGEFQDNYTAEMLRRDPRDPKYGLHPGVSQADMSAEFARRLFEQHERLERSLHEVLKEVHELRKEVAALKK